MAPLLFIILAIALVLAGFALVRPGRPRLTVREGRKLMASGDLDRAQHVFNYLSSSRNPVRVREQATYWLGEVLFALGRDDEAQAVYLDYLRVFSGRRADPDRLRRVKHHLGARLLEHRHQRMRPFQPFHESDAQDSSDIRLLGLDDGVHLLEIGEPKRALAVLKPAIDYAVDAPGRERALLYLGLAYEALHSSSLACEAYGQYVSDYADSAGVSHTETVRVLVKERLRSLEEDGADAAPLPWEVFREGLAGVRERLGGAAASPAPASASIVAHERVAPETLRRDLNLLDVGTTVGGYVLAEKLGEGGFGEVYRALRLVAIKFARDPESIDRLRRLADLQAEVDSDRIVRPIEVDLTSNPPFVVMEFVDGPNLRDLFQAGRLEPEVALAICQEVALGLSDAHRAGVWHLDLKPENVLLDPSGRIKLTDFEFGRAGAEVEGLEQSLALSQESRGGTLAYMSPEQRSGKAVDARSDVFTFGVLFFEALTGMLPEPGDKPSQFVDGLPDQVDAIFERCFARHERRYADASQLAVVLEQALAALPRPPALREVFARAPRPQAEVDASPAPNPGQSAQPTGCEDETESAQPAGEAQPPTPARPSLASLMAAQERAAADLAEDPRVRPEPLAEPPVTT